MDLKLIHETQYAYQSPVVLSQQLLHLKPRELPWQSLRSFHLEISPQATELTEGKDYFGNPVSSFVIASPHSQLVVRSESEVRVAARMDALAGGASGAWDTLRDRLRSPEEPPLLEAQQFLFESPHIDFLRELYVYAAPTFTPARSMLECVRELARRIHADFKFDPKATSVATPLRDVLAKRRGVCQDFAHLMIGCLRALGLPARYVSGYILTRPPPGRPRLIGADASHAWVSAYCPPLGWVDVDPTNNCLVDDEHVTLAWGRDFSDVPPLRGVILGGDDQELKVAVTVLPLDERGETGAGPDAP
jgi:transglutaminase-like putative cysteine protease